MPEDIQWLRSAANDLNNLLQVISESSKSLEPICQNHPEGQKYLRFLRDSLGRATEVTSQIVGKLGGVPDSPATSRSQPSAAASAEAAELILIIDDEEVVAGLAGRMLQEAGYRVAIATQPMRALEFFRDRHADVSLVMLDFAMPVMNGSEVFEELLAINPKAAVMLSSGFAEQEKVRAMLAKGLRGFLPKPFTKEKLVSQVRTTLAAVRAERTGERRVL